MATKLPPVDILIVGMGWTGGILAKELAPTGLKIAVIERGGVRRSTSLRRGAGFKSERAWPTRTRRAQRSRGRSRP